MLCCYDTPWIEEYDTLHERVELEYIARHAESGDVFFSSGSGIWSRTVRLFSDSDIWSHEAIYIRSEKDKQLYILDADTAGVRLTRFEDFLERYNGNYFGLRKLLNVTKEQRKEYTLKLEEFAKKHLGKSYSTPLTLIKSLTRLNGHNAENQDRLYCVQLVIKAYRHLGIVEKVKKQRSSNAKLTDFLSSDGSITGYTSNVQLSDDVYYAEINVEE